MAKELVSIILPAFNSSKFIGSTIESIRKQTYTDWELLITDDGSTDKTINVINKHQKEDSRIKLFILKVNSGAGVARNNSIKKANGKYIAFCDSDDLWVPHKLTKQIDFMKKNNLFFTYSSFEIIDENGVFISTVTSPAHLTYKDLLKSNKIGCLTAIYDTHYLGKLYMSNIRNRQDWVLWLNILKKIKFTKGLKESLALYRKRKGSISRNKFKMISYHWFVYRQEMKINLYKSVVLLFQNIIYHIKRNG